MDKIIDIIEYSKVEKTDILGDEKVAKTDILVLVKVTKTDNWCYCFN